MENDNRYIFKRRSLSRLDEALYRVNNSDVYEPPIRQKYKEFAENYLETMNAAESYRRVYGEGKNSNTDAAAGARLKRNPEVQEYLKFLIDRNEDILEINEALLVREVGKFIRSEELTPSKLRAIELEGKRIGRYEDKVQIEKKDIIVSLD